MSDKFLKVAVQYTKQTAVEAHVRPYLNGLPLTNEIQMWLDVEKLPQEAHWRVELAVQVLGRNSEGLLCFEASSSVEAIVLAGGLTDDELDESLRYSVAPGLLGTVRVNIANASADTGYGPLVLPPADATKVAQLPSLRALPDENEPVPQAEKAL